MFHDFLKVETDVVLPVDRPYGGIPYPVEGLFEVHTIYGRGPFGAASSSCKGLLSCSSTMQYFWLLFSNNLIFSACGFHLFRITFNVCFCGWLMRLIVQQISQYVRSPFLTLSLQTCDRPSPLPKLIWSADCLLVPWAAVPSIKSTVVMLVSWLAAPCAKRVRESDQ